MLPKAVFGLFLLAIALNHVQSAKILGVFSMGRSHYFLARALMRALAEHGNDVTVISLNGEKNPPKNTTYRDIALTEIGKEMDDLFSSVNMFEMEDSNALMTAIFVNTIIPPWTERMLKDPRVQELIDSEEKFDVVIVEQFMNDALKAFALHFKAPLIAFGLTCANPWVNDLVANPSPYSYIPSLSSGYSPIMTFKERLYNTLSYLSESAVANLYAFPKHNEYVKKYFPGNLDLYDILYNASLILVNSHPTLNQAVPKVPNMIDIGGFHVQPPKKLPKDLQEYLDAATDGAIYFSMGSNLKSAKLPLEKRNAILKAFGKRKERVLWKWEDDSLPGKPDNVKIGKWLPQQDILAHPNVKLFITHGGLLSTTETVYHGVPILAIPIFGDQKSNAKVAVENGIGLSLLFTELNEERLSHSLKELLENPKYTNNAKRTSKLFHDRPLKPLDEAIYWVEYVARHRGAPHLRVAGVDLPWYVYQLVDVVVFLSLVVLVALYVQYRIGKILFKKIFGKKNTKSVTKLKKTN